MPLKKWENISKMNTREKGLKNNFTRTVQLKKICQGSGEGNKDKRYHKK